MNYALKNYYLLTERKSDKKCATEWKEQCQTGMGC